MHLTLWRHYGLTTTQLDGFVYNVTPKLRAVLVLVNVAVVRLSINLVLPTINFSIST